MTGYNEDDLDFLLRKQFDGPVADDGFCEHVMARLPARRHRIKWPLFAGTFAGLVAYWLSLWSAPISYAGWQDWILEGLAESVISLFIAAMGIAVSTLVWALSETDEGSVLIPQRRIAGI